MRGLMLGGLHGLLVGVDGWMLCWRLIGVFQVMCRTLVLTRSSCAALQLIDFDTLVSITLCNMSHPTSFLLSSQATGCWI